MLFAEEVNCLRASKLLLKTSVIIEFNPFLNTDELIRVGGRLQKSKFSYLQIVTYNAKTFKRSGLELKNLWKVISDPAVNAFYASHKIYWQFIIERAPWWGGFYERLIRTLTLALRKTVGRTTLFRDQLETL
ncbi:integrase catalytic domain-containing protein [Trichonephila clavipes]|nr:integrase catalytic domain-containing protein [Trichonephila clavipes]